MTSAHFPGRTGTSLALSDRHRSWTFDEVGRATDVLGEHLAGLRTDPRAPVAHQFDLAPEAVVAVHAVARAGTKLAVAHVGWTPAERERFLRAVAPEVVLTSARAASETPPGPEWSADIVQLPSFPPVAVWRRERPAERHVRSAASAGSPVASAGLPVALAGSPEWSAGSPAATPPGTQVLLWTSGSEGAPRAACHTWAALVANARACNERLDFGSGDAWLTPLAWGHVGGLAVLVRSAVSGGRMVLGEPRFDAAAVGRTLREQGVTHVSLVPAMLHRMLDHAGPPPESLRVALVGGAATPLTLIERAMERGWPIALTYGSTEAGSQIATAPPPEARVHPRTVGSPLACTEVRLRSGEIEVRGSALFLGYLGDAPPAPGAWFGTGDLGTADVDGRLTVTGRRSTRIVTGGANVDPTEVEAVLAGHPDVIEACVIGTPDEVWGEVVTAFVVGRGAELERRLDEWVRERLSGPRRPRRWRILSALPRTVTGKVDGLRLASLDGLEAAARHPNSNEAVE